MLKRLSYSGERQFVPINGAGSIENLNRKHHGLIHTMDDI